MCTSSPRCWIGTASAGAVRAAASAVSWRRSSRRPSGPSTTTSASRPGRSRSSEAEQTSRPGSPSARSERDGLERLDVAEVVAGEDDAAGLQLVDEGPHGVTLVHARERDLDHVAAGLDDRGRGAWRARASGGSSRSNAAGGSVEPAGVHGDREALLLDVRLGGVGAAQHARQLALNVASPRGGRGEIRRSVVEDQRSLPYWPKTNSSPPWSPIALPTSSRPPRASAWRAGRPVTTATARTTLGEVDERRSGASGWMCAALGVVDDRREGAVEVEADDEVVDGAHDGGVLLRAPSVGGELHGLNPTTCGARARTQPALHRGEARAEGQRGASAVRMTVSRSKLHRRRRPARCA